TRAATFARSMLSMGVGLFPLSFALPLLGRDRLGRMGLAAIAAALAAYLVAFPSALGQRLLRYACAITVPWLSVGLARVFERLETGLIATGTIVLVVAQVIATRAAIPVGFPFADMKASAEWIDAHTPPDAVVLVHDAGGISELGHRRA